MRLITYKTSSKITKGINVELKLSSGPSIPTMVMGNYM